jgi:hypothetical protein
VEETRFRPLRAAHVYLPSWLRGLRQTVRLQLRFFPLSLITLSRGIADVPHAIRLLSNGTTQGHEVFCH